MWTMSFSGQQYWRPSELKEAGAVSSDTAARGGVEELVPDSQGSLSGNRHLSIQSPGVLAWLLPVALSPYQADPSPVV